MGAMSIPDGDANKSTRVFDMMAISKRRGVGLIISDQCMFGLTTTTRDGHTGLARKPTRLLSNSSSMLEELP